MKTNSSNSPSDRLAEAAEQSGIEERAEKSSSQNAGEDETDLAADALAEDERPDAGVPPSSAGTQAPRVQLEDEASAAEEEIEEGLDEADADTRAKSGHRF
jgi:hypothetical protein